MNERRAIALVVLFYCAISIGLLSPLLFSGQTPFLADITYNNEPASTFVTEFWQQHGKFPLWNPWVLNGVPQIAVNWPMMYFPSAIGLGSAYGVGTGLFMFAHLLLAGLGGFLWQFKSHRFQPKNYLAAIFFGISFMLCGYMFSCPINLLLMASVAWIPWVLLMLDSICSAPQWWQCGILSLFMGMQFSAGRPEIAVASSILYLCYFFCNIGALRIRALLMVAVSFLLAIGLASFGYIPLIELAMNSPSALQFSVLKSTHWSAGRLDWLTLLITQPLGPITMVSTNEVVTYPGALPYVTSLFIGAPVLTLSVLSLLRNWRHSQSSILLVVISVLFALGEFGPLGDLINDQSVMRYPIKLAIFALLGLLVMAANGWRNVFGGVVRRSNIISMGLFWVVIALVAATVHKIGLDLGIHQHFLLKGLMIASLCGLVSSVLMLLKNRWTETIFLALVTFSLIVNDQALLKPLVPNSYFSKSSPVADLIKHNCQLDPKNYRVLPLIDNSLPLPKQFENVPDNQLEQQFSSYCRDILRPNTTIDAHLQSANGISVIPTWNSLFIDTGLIPRSTLSSVKHPLGKSDVPLYRYCQATSTAYVETIKNAQNDDGTLSPLPVLDKKYFHLLTDDEALNIRLYEIVHIRPRVSINQKLIYQPTREDALKYINRADVNGFDPLNEVTLVGAEKQRDKAASITSKSLSNYAEVQVDQNEYIKISANATAPSALVLTDGYYPGWEAFDNGKPTEIYIADGVMRAILLEPGEHRIVFRYRPTSWTYGLILFFASLTTASFMILSKFTKQVLR